MIKNMEQEIIQELTMKLAQSQLNETILSVKLKHLEEDLAKAQNTNKEKEGTNNVKEN
ncbi:hypothetical protein FC36_GL001848 [Ligilactobacillus equi DSM 15833 = JCM 10991]|uniref:Uncharacterized protein n=2 Tax=Ligilactobacillus equi TaxID=137357 RepID=A0A0R1TCW8_9LACO|nr:hypothetical protein FC36_GL001848 [Ligilactobacillus equi DSM 15833 = JCM 10991]